ncbi:MAG: hypothetical protein JNM45_02190, partial [Rhizobiales bacterium]|nr:hypothetical protein [Hyphomicrobiales bacterium]
DHIAEAVGATPDDFSAKLEALYSLGFPLPTSAGRDEWSVLELLDWITERQELAVQFVSYLAQYIEDGSSAT